MTRYTSSMKLSVVITGFVICLCSGMYSSDSRASDMNQLDQALDSISARGDIAVGGNLTNTCTTGSNAVCIGTYVWTDDHSNDQSVNKGALILSGNVQQNLTTNINVTTTASPTATGANVIGTIDVPVAGATVSLTNSNNATGFLGGF